MNVCQALQTHSGVDATAGTRASSPHVQLVLFTVSLCQFDGKSFVNTPYMDCSRSLDTQPSRQLGDLLWWARLWSLCGLFQRTHSFQPSSPVVMVVRHRQVLDFCQGEFKRQRALQRARRDSRLLTPIPGFSGGHSCSATVSPERFRSAEALLQVESVRSLLSKLNPSISRVRRRLLRARHVCGQPVSALQKRGWTADTCTCVSLVGIRIISQILSTCSESLQSLLGVCVA